MAEVVHDSAGDAVVVDARGLACPMPVIELAKTIRAGAAGTRVRLLADDPAAKVDVPVWCRMQRHHLLSQSDHPEGGWTFVVEKVSVTPSTRDRIPPPM